MPVPVFVIYELLIRIHEHDPSIGSYVSHNFNNTGVVIFTTTKKIKIRNAILNRQFKDPELIFDADLLLLAKSS